SGLAGIVAGMFLSRRGHKVTLFERHGNPEKVTGAAGRSINLTLTKRGIDALDSIGVGEAIRNESIPLFQRIVHHPDGLVTKQSYDDAGNGLYSIARGTLNRILHSHAREH